MKALIQKVRRQPAHVRELVTLACTVVVVAIVGVIWFNSFQRDVYALLNPEQEASEDRHFAQESKSIFGSMLETLKNGQAQISNFFKGEDSNLNINNNYSSPEPVNPLPVTDSR